MVAWWKRKKVVACEHRVVVDEVGVFAYCKKDRDCYQDECPLRRNK